MLRKDAKIELLKRIPLFAQCSKKELGSIAQITEERRIESGAVLIDEGEPGHEIYVVVEGLLEMSRRGSGAFATSGPGELVGEMALFSDKPRSATVTAATPVRLLRIGDGDFLALVDRLPHLWLKLAASLADRVPDDERIDAHYRD